MNQQPPANLLFDDNRRSAFLDRAYNRRSAVPFLWDHLAKDFRDNLSLVSRPFERALIVGPMAFFAETILQDRSVETILAPTSKAEAQAMGVFSVSERNLPFDAASFDLIIAGGNLDSVNDLPGLLVQIRRLLVPDGLFLGSLFGAGTLARLKSAMLRAGGDRATSHIHPQIELRTAADLLSRAGFAMPVADQEILTVRYADWRRLVEDLREHGLGNALSGQRRYLGNKFLQKLDEAWRELCDADDKVSEHFALLNLSGWSPSPDQRKPARRGSALVSLTDVFPSRPPGQA